MKRSILFLSVIVFLSQMSYSQSPPVMLPGFPVILDSIDYTFNNGPIIADFDLDGRNEVFVGVNVYSLTGKVFLIRENGEVKSGFPKSVSCIQSYINIAAGDIDKDGKLDFVVKSDSLYVFDQFGNHISGFPVYIPLPSNTLSDKMALYDLDSDGRTEIILGRGNTIHVVNSNGEIRTGWPVSFNQGGTTFLSYISIGDLNSDGMAEMIIPSSNNITTPSQDSSKIYILQEDGSNYPSSPIISDSGYYFDFWNYGIIYKADAEAFFTVISNFPKYAPPGPNSVKTKVTTYDAELSTIYTTVFPQYHNNESLTMGNLNDSKKYFLFGDLFFTSAVSLSGNMLGGYPIFLEGRNLRNHNTGKVFGQSCFVATAPQDTFGGAGLRGYVKFYSVESGLQVGESMRALGTPGTAPNLTDLNKDGQLDVIVTTNGVINGGDGCAIYAWTIPGVPYKREDFPWPMWGHDRYRTNQYGFIPPDEPVGIQPINTNIPAAFKLYQNFPNPFNPATSIKFDIAKKGNVKLVVFDMLGRELSTLINESLNPGTYQVSFDGSGLSSGIYFCRLQSEDYVNTMKMNLIK